MGSGHGSHQLCVHLRYLCVIIRPFLTRWHTSRLASVLILILSHGGAWANWSEPISEQNVIWSTSGIISNIHISTWRTPLGTSGTRY
ncbi:hypothetical protein V8E53_011485 [Lactarius tabidus]